jgi:lauroyl/myristoyl acyltransferase
MKQKLRVSKMSEKVSNFAMWLIIAVFALFLMVGSANAQPVQSEVVTVSQKGKNPYLKKYHKQNRKNFKCSACPDKGFRKLLPKSWR